MFYFVMKTGLPMFDACRAYGLAVILEELSIQAEAVEQVHIEDLGVFYQLSGADAKTLLSVESIEALDYLLAPSNGWCGTLLTTARSPKLSRVKPKSYKALEEVIAEVKRVLGDLPRWLPTLSQPLTCEIRISNRKGLQSIPGSLDVSAFKGIRRLKLDGYTEGEKIHVPEEQWVLGLVGGANFIRWTWAGGNYAGLLPAPQSVLLRNHQDIRIVANADYLCGVSTITAAAHYAVQLTEALRQRQASQVRTANHYTNIIIQSMAFAGNQWKAMSGSLFPLDFPLSLLERDLNIAANIFDQWNSLFRWGSVRGNETLAVMLADFLAQPSLDSFEQYARIHLRMTLADERRRHYSPYQTEWMEEILNYVK